MSPAVAQPARPASPADETCILVLQDGGALGACQAGVYESLSAMRQTPEWMAGISISAINAALIGGNPRGSTSTSSTRARCASPWGPSTSGAATSSTSTPATVAWTRATSRLATTCELRRRRPYWAAGTSDTQTTLDDHAGASASAATQACACST